MSRKPKSSPPRTEHDKSLQPYRLPDGAPWYGFVNVNLSDAMRGEFNHWYNNLHQDVPEMLIDIMARGVKASISYDAENQCFIVSLIGGLCAAEPDGRFCCVSRSDVLNEAIALAVYKHTMIAGGDYSKFIPRGKEITRWG